MSSDIENLINNSNIFSSNRVDANINSLTEVLSNNKRLMAGFKTGTGEHAVMVNKIKVWPNGNYKIWFAETSPIRIAPTSTTQMFNLRGIGFFSFYPR